MKAQRGWMGSLVEMTMEGYSRAEDGSQGMKGRKEERKQKSNSSQDAGL